MHKESTRITIALELYAITIALIFGVVIYILLQIDKIPMFVKWIIIGILSAAVFVAVFIFAPLFGRSVSHFLSGSILAVSYGAFLKYTVNVDFRRVVYVAKLRGPFERMTGVVILLFYFSGGCVFVPVGDRSAAERYVRKWTQRIQ